MKSKCNAMQNKTLCRLKCSLINILLNFKSHLSSVPLASAQNSSSLKRLQMLKKKSLKLMFFLKRYDNAGFLFKNFRILRLSDKKVDSNFFNLNERDKVNTLLYGSQTDDSKCFHREILKFVIAYIKATTRFDRSLISNH